MKALLDGDEAIFKAASITADEYDWDGDGSAQRRPATFQECQRAIKRMFQTWTDSANCSDFVVVLSPQDRRLFRRGLFADYKAGRGEKPQHFHALEQWVHDTYPVEWRPGLEADDVLGILSGDDTVICSQDKDMKTVPGRLFNPGKNTLGVISQTRADWQWMLQTLTGDSTDGFAGCTGCGPKGAEELLDRGTSLREWWPLVVERFEQPKVGRAAKFPAQSRKDAIQQASLARILRPGEYAEDGTVRYPINRIPIAFNAHAIAR